jgi:hypothetical protein
LDHLCCSISSLAYHKFYIYFTFISISISISITMSDHTTANTPSEPILCQAGCGFFGNEASGNCCSKCWGEKQTKNNMSASATTCQVIPEENSQVERLPSPPASPVKEEQVVLTTLKRKQEEEQVVTTADSLSPTEPPKKKRKQKTGYKAMLASMTKARPKDVANEEKRLLQGLGGGAFSKIDKI